MSEEVKAPIGTVFILSVPFDREDSKRLIFYLKDMDEETFMMAKSLIDIGKEFDATRAIIKTLSLVGSDPVESLKGNFTAINSAKRTILEMIRPMDGELKKN